MYMTKLKSALVGAALLGSASAFAAPTLTNSLGSFGDWGGFDWASNGTAVAVGFNPALAVNNFDLTYWASAVAVTNSGGSSIALASFGLQNSLVGGLPVFNTPTYEYTIQVQLNETSTCLDPVIIGGCSAASFAINSGSFTVWYDTTPDANQVTGAGITNGEILFSGTIGAQPGGAFDVISGGNSTLFGEIDFTNLAFVSEPLQGTTATSTLQIGANITGWIAPTGMPDVGGGTQLLPAGTIALQADANQSIVTEVPEPGVLALLGLAFGGLGVSRMWSRKQG